MKFVVLLLFIVNVALTGFAQRFEPEFSNSGVLISQLSSDTILTKLQRTPLSYTSPSAWSFTPKVHAVAKGNTSNCVVSIEEPFAIIVKMKDNDDDLQSFMKIVKMEQKKKERKIEMASMNVWTEQIKEGNNMNEILFDASRYGVSSYILYPNIVDPGEYGLLIYNPNNNDEKPAQILCFSVK